MELSSDSVPSRDPRRRVPRRYREAMANVPERMRPPREEGWFADDLDPLPEAPAHTELIDGMLVFRARPSARGTRAWSPP